MGKGGPVSRPRVPAAAQSLEFSVTHSYLGYRGILPCSVVIPNSGRNTRIPPGKNLVAPAQAQRTPLPIGSGAGGRDTACLPSTVVGTGRIACRSRAGISGRRAARDAGQQRYAAVCLPASSRLGRGRQLSGYKEEMDQAGRPPRKTRIIGQLLRLLAVSPEQRSCRRNRPFSVSRGPTAGAILAVAAAATMLTEARHGGGSDELGSVGYMARESESRPTAR